MNFKEAVSVGLVIAAALVFVALVLYLLFNYNVLTKVDTM